MSYAQKILILTGVLLIGITMLFGSGYALFDQQQTLVGMGMAMTQGFTEAAQSNMHAAHAAMEQFGAISQEYRRKIHAHGHWGVLSLILLILGLVFNRLQLSDKNQQLLAWLLSASAFLFPLGVLLQIWALTAPIGALLAIPASSGMIIGLLITGWALLKEPDGSEN
jgi:hypothetical protein